MDIVDIDDLIYPLLAASFPDYEEGEVLDIVEEFKQPRGLDENSEFEQEVWQKYCRLKREFGGAASRSDAAAQRPREAAAQG